MVGCSDAVYMYNEEGRGACFAFPGAKQLLLSFRGYLLVVVGGGGGGGGGGGDSGGAQLNVYDVANHLTAHAMTVRGVAHVLCDAAAVTIVQVRRAMPTLSAHRKPKPCVHGGVDHVNGSPGQLMRVVHLPRVRVSLRGKRVGGLLHVFTMPARTVACRPVDDRE